MDSKISVSGINMIDLKNIEEFAEKWKEANKKVNHIETVMHKIIGHLKGEGDVRCSCISFAGPNWRNEVPVDDDSLAELLPAIHGLLNRAKKERDDLTLRVGYGLGE